MKEAYLIFLVVASASTLSIIDHEWEAFKIKFNKRYDSEEDLQRRKIFNENKIMIEEHNKKFEEGKVTFTMGVNKFADMFPEEMSLLRGYKHNEDYQAGLLYKSEVGVTYPDTVDWREHGYVTPVKDQRTCMSSWAFSATGALEGQNFARNGTLFSLSEQNLIDCIYIQGCHIAGTTQVAFEYVKINDGIDTEEGYPYNSYRESPFCKYDCTIKGGTCTGYASIEPGNESDLMAATATVGPISVAIDAQHETFIYYKSGVYYEPECNSKSLNHAVLVVGYDNYNGSDYWIVKNSYGIEWGDEGYIMMARNKDNNCGIATDANYPLV